MKGSWSAQGQLVARNCGLWHQISQIFRRLSLFRHLPPPKDANLALSSNWHTSSFSILYNETEIKLIIEGPKLLWIVSVRWENQALYFFDILCQTYLIYHPMTLITFSSSKIRALLGAAYSWQSYNGDVLWKRSQLRFLCAPQSKTRPRPASVSTGKQLHGGPWG